MSDADHPPRSAPDDPTRGRRRLRRLGVLAVVLSFVGIWGYVLYLSIFEGRAEPRDRLDDRAWAATAEETCADASAGLERLPFASEVADPAERAAVLDDATEQLEVMVQRLDALVPPASPAEADAVGRWLIDWREYLANRRAYADRFRSGIDEPFRVTDRGGFQIDVLIDDFARVNDMESCETPDDVG